MTPETTAPRPNPMHVLAAFASGGLLTLMVHFNGQLAFYGNALFSSWTAHTTGTIAALVLLFVLNFRRRPPATSPAATPARPKAPLWAYLGGISGAATVMLTASTVNSALALSGTLALGLAGQFLFGLAADFWGLFGMPQRRPDFRDMTAFSLIIAGSTIVIFAAGAA